MLCERFENKCARVPNACCHIHSNRQVWHLIIFIEIFSSAWIKVWMDTFRLVINYIFISHILLFSPSYFLPLFSLVLFFFTPSRPPPSACSFLSLLTLFSFFLSFSHDLSLSLSPSFFHCLLLSSPPFSPFPLFFSNPRSSAINIFNCARAYDTP